VHAVIERFRSNRRPDPTPLPFDRSSMLERLTADTFDVVIVGGGVTGCGIALDAAARGLTVALLERDDFAAGTSSKSSKLIHGGLRYLQHGDVRLVYEALRERQRLLRNAPHLVTVLPFLIPVLTKDGPVSKKIAKALRSALWMYDITGGWRIGRRHRRLDAAAALAHCPTLPADRLSSAFVYYDAQADDARLTLTIARTAADHGAVVVNRCVVDAISVGDDGRQVVAVGDAESGGTIDVTGRCVVSAAGIWSDAVRELDEGVDPDTIRPAKGVHLTLPWHLVGNDIAVIISVPKDKRSLFLIPWGPLPDGTFERCYVGTTDTDFVGHLDDPQTNADDLEYVLRALNHSIIPPTGEPITTHDVTAVWAGLRPLVKSATSGRTADLSRRHRVTTSPNGVVSVTGGKLTTYRAMAADTVDVVMKRLGRRGRSPTARLRLHGCVPSGRPGVDHLTRRFGTDADQVRRLVDADPGLARPLVPGLAYLRAEAVYAARHEMATTLVDVLARRTRAHLEDRAACLAAASAIAELLAGELGWDARRTSSEVTAYVALCDAELAAATVPDARHAVSQGTIESS
jgi:glycerol-3-phosphate dehydrogenase